MRGKRWVKSAFLSAATAIAVAGLPARGVFAGALPAESAAEAVLKDLQQQRAILLAPNSTLPQREQAAKKLVSRSSREADQILLSVLDRPESRDAQLAVARALIDDPTPEAAYITPLANLMGSNWQLTEAAAQALASFKTDDRARDRLMQFATDIRQRAESRARAVLAMGKLVDKRAAGKLVEIMNGPTEDRRVVDAAKKALVDMTGLAGFDDEQQWNQWWANNRNRPDAEWSNDLLVKNARRASELNKRLDQTRAKLFQFIRLDRAAAKTPQEKAERDKKLIEYLKSDVEDQRIVAVQVVEYEMSQAGGAAIAPEVMKATQQLVGDSSAEVRGQVAPLLYAASAVDAVLTQLSQETDAKVEVALLQALGRSRDIRAIKPLLARLNDPSFAVARAAADAVRDLAQPLRDKKRTADLAAIAAALRQRWRETSRDPATARLRESLVSAMAAVADASLREVFYDVLKPGQESAEVRLRALRGLGAIGDSGSANIIFDRISDPDRDVRLAAVEALATTASFGHAQGIYQRLRDEPDPAVREQIWKVLSGLFEKGSAAELVYWQDLFRGNDPVNLNRRLRVLTVREGKLAAAKEEKALANLRQNLAEVLLNLNDPEKAATALQLALDYWTSHNATEAEINLPRQYYLRALLQAKKYGDAVDYATNQIKANQAITSDMWRIVSEELARLENNRDTQTALAMIATVKKIPWDTLYGQILEQREQRLRARATSGGAIWVRQPKNDYAAAGQAATS